VAFTPSTSGTFTAIAGVVGGGDTVLTNNNASDITIVLAAVPTLPPWAMTLLTGLLAVAGVAAMRRRAASARRELPRIAD
jgi:hypothetical protein